MNNIFIHSYSDWEVIMKVTAFVGNGRKKHTYQAVESFFNHLQKYDDITGEIVLLSDWNLKTCKGCLVCFDKGEEYCPHQDDRDILVKKMEESDGVIFATPNYSFHVSGYMKIFLDRIAYIFHRPRFFGKTFSGIVNQGIFGGTKITSYLNFISKPLGFSVVPAICLTTREPAQEKTLKQNEKKIEVLAKKFYGNLKRKNKLKKPSLFELMIFRMSRAGIKNELNEEYRDYTYYRDMGWFESDFYYPVGLPYFTKIIGNLIDRSNHKKVQK